MVDVIIRERLAKENIIINFSVPFISAMVRFGGVIPEHDIVRACFEGIRNNFDCQTEFLITARTNRSGINRRGNTEILEIVVPYEHHVRGFGILGTAQTAEIDPVMSEIRFLADKFIAVDHEITAIITAVDPYRVAFKVIELIVQDFRVLDNAD